MSECSIAQVKVQHEPKRLRPPGYGEDVILKKYWKGCKIEDGQEKCGEEVDCSKAIPVVLEINPHELKKVDDQSEQFQLIFVMKMYWEDPKLHSFQTKVVRCKPEPKVEPGTTTFFEAPLEEVEGIVRRKYRNGDLLFVEKDSNGYKPAVILKKDEYVRMEEPDWNNYFFPHYTLTNLVGVADGDEHGSRKLLFCNETSGGFVEYTKRFDATFQETLELKRFPLDKQVLQIKLTAEADISVFQFVLLDNGGHAPQVSGEEWSFDASMQKKCTTYLRYADEKFPFHIQRSLVKTVLHVQRKSNYFFHNVLINIFLVNFIALFAFSVSIPDVGDRLGLLSGTLVAVTAYQSVINALIPRKPHLTLCDKYVIFAVVFQVGVGLETVILAFYQQFAQAGLEPEQVEELADLISNIDWIIGAAFAGLWIVSNGAVLLLFDYMYADWKAVYDSNEEPFAPMQECLTCRGRWLCKQATLKKEKKLWRCPFCNENQPGRIRQHYYSPGCKGFDAPLVPRLKDKTFRDKMYQTLKESNPKDAEDFNQKFRPGAVLE